MVYERNDPYYSGKTAESTGGFTLTGPVNYSNVRVGEERDRPGPTQDNANKEVVQAYSGFPTVSATPIMPSLPTPPPVITVKSATPEIILWDDSSVPAEILTDLIFENIGGQELLSLSRHDTVSGDNVSTQLIKNLTFLNQQNSSKKILSLQNTSDKYFSNFAIKLESKIPFVGNGPEGTNIYVDESTQDIIIEFVNLEVDERIEVQIGIGGTIYTITLGANI